MECEIKWLGEPGISFFAKTGSGHTLEIDTVQAEEKQSIGPRPMEIFLTGAISCTLYDLVSGIKEKGGVLHSCNAKAHGNRKTTNPKIFTEIKVDFTIQAENISSETIKDILKSSRETYGSAIKMLEKSAHISFNFNLSSKQS